MIEVSRQRKSPQSVVSFLTHPLPLEHETAVFILVNVLDFLMTYWMLAHRTADGERMFVESNPVAAYFLHRWGPFRGMLLFKLIVVTVVCVSTQLIATRKPVVAQWLLRIGTAAVAAVVIYSTALYLQEGMHSG